MCDGIREDFDDILAQDRAWIEETRQRREAEAHRAERTPQYVYSAAHQETSIEANISIRKVVKVHHHTPLQARAILALLLVLVAVYLGYLIWPYHELVAKLVIAALILLALLGLLRLAWPMIDQLYVNRVLQQIAVQTQPHHAYPEAWSEQEEQAEQEHPVEQEMYLYQH